MRHRRDSWPKATVKAAIRPELAESTSWITRILPRSRFRRWTWGSAVTYIVLVIALGALGYTLEDGRVSLESFYRAIQLFGLNYQAPEDKIPNGLIEIARFLAPIVLIAALIKLLAEGFGEMVRLAAHTRIVREERDAVLGFGPVGREIGRRLLVAGRRVTWIAMIDGAEENLRAARDDAEEMGGFLLIADPSAPASFLRARLERCKRVFVALENDLACLDAAEALRGWLADDAICVIEEQRGLAIGFPPGFETLDRRGRARGRWRAGCWQGAAAGRTRARRPPRRWARPDPAGPAGPGRRGGGRGSWRGRWRWRIPRPGRRREPPAAGPGGGPGPRRGCR